MDTLHTTPQLCPVCGHTLDAHTNTTGSGGPKVGDFTVCIYCAGILRYDEDFKCRAITLDEAPEECRAQLERVVDAIKALQATSMFRNRKRDAANA